MSFLFQHRSEVHIRAAAVDEDALLESLISLEADGYELCGTDEAVVHGSFESLESLQNGLRDQGWTVREWSHCWHPLTLVTPVELEDTRQCLRLLDALEELDDVSGVSANLELQDGLPL